jgi:hypothetical protein
MEGAVAVFGLWQHVWWASPVEGATAREHVLDFGSAVVGSAENRMVRQCVLMYCSSTYRDRSTNRTVRQVCLKALKWSVTS